MDYSAFLFYGGGRKVGKIGEEDLKSVLSIFLKFLSSYKIFVKVRFSIRVKTAKNIGLTC